MGLGTLHTNYFTSPWYYTQDYDVQDFGRTSSNHFFTDTIFYDANTNRIYDEGEGVPGVEVHLWQGANEAAWYDVSQTSGCFVVPINDLVDGSEVSVELRNTNAAPVQVTIPLGYLSVGDRTLAAGASWTCASFTQPNGITNVGFRSSTAWSSGSSLQINGTNIVMNVSGFRRASYRIEYMEPETGSSWNLLGSITATGNYTSVSLPDTSLARMYRAILLKD